jgi:hypothetical protein
MKRSYYFGRFGVKIGVRRKSCFWYSLKSKRGGNGFRFSVNTMGLNHQLAEGFKRKLKTENRFWEMVGCCLKGRLPWHLLL